MTRLTFPVVVGWLLVLIGLSVTATEWWLVAINTVALLGTVLLHLGTRIRYT